jgi:hypothetical protein
MIIHPSKKRVDVSLCINEWGDDGGFFKEGSFL